MTRQALDVWEPLALEEVKHGRTGPLVLTCARDQDPAPVPAQFLVKALGLNEITVASLRNEVLGGLLARKCGLSAPRVALIRIDADAAAALNQSLRQRGVQVQPGLAVGSEYVRSGLAGVGRFGAVPASAEEERALLYAFDLLVQNPDRRPDNPNCAIRAGHLMPYDFELCFTFLLLLGGGGDPCDIAKHGIGQKHLFFSGLKGTAVDFKPFIAALAKITPKLLDQMVALLPVEWRDDQVLRIREHILAVRSRRKEFEIALLRSLA